MRGNKWAWMIWQRLCSALHLCAYGIVALLLCFARFSLDAISKAAYLTDQIVIKTGYVCTRKNN